MERYISRSEKQTAELGAAVAAKLKAGDVVALSGDLGCGKTAFVKGVTGYFGNAADVCSPTFTLVNEYNGSVPIYHFDVYRLGTPEPEQCDWMDDYLFGDGICLIEWADNLRDVLPDNTIRIEFAKNPAEGEDYREITVF